MHRLAQIAVLSLTVIVAITLLQGCTYGNDTTRTPRHYHSMLYGTQAAKNLAAKTGHPW